MRLLGLLALCVSMGCGSSSSNTPSSGGAGKEDAKESVATPDDTGGTPDKEALCTHAMQTATAAHDEAWAAVEAKGAPETLEDMANAACHLYCGRATVCAIEEACAELSAAEVADLKLEKTAPENTRQCIDKCNTWRLSKAQIQVLGRCSQEDSDCATWRACVDKAQAQ